jgi:hypothetical protein
MISFMAGADPPDIDGIRGAASLVTIVTESSVPSRKKESSPDLARIGPT